ncbi:hypothetical protein GCM10022238_09460 [Gordonia hankookensis]
MPARTVPVGCGAATASGAAMVVIVPAVRVRADIAATTIRRRRPIIRPPERRVITVWVITHRAPSDLRSDRRRTPFQDATLATLVTLVTVKQAARRNENSRPAVMETVREL